MSAEDVATLVLLGSLSGVAVTGLIIAGRWIANRGERRLQRWEFADDFVAEADDVALAQLEVDLLIGIAEVDDERMRVNHEFDRLLERAS